MLCNMEIRKKRDFIYTECFMYYVSGCVIMLSCVCSMFVL